MASRMPSSSPHLSLQTTPQILLLLRLSELVVLSVLPFSYWPTFSSSIYFFVYSRHLVNISSVPGTKATAEGRMQIDGLQQGSMRGAWGHSG